LGFSVDDLYIQTRFFDLAVALFAWGNVMTFDAFTKSISILFLMVLPLSLVAVLPPPASAQVQNAVLRATEVERCPIPSEKWPRWWRDSERFAWAQICSGEVADLQFAKNWRPGYRVRDLKSDGLGCGAFSVDNEAPETLLKAKFWPQDRHLRPAFLKQVLTREPWINVPARRIVSIRCALIPDRLNLDHEHIVPTFSLSASRLVRGISLNDVRLNGDLTIRDSLVRSGIRAEGMKVEGDVVIDASYVERAQFDNGEVRGNFSSAKSIIPQMLLAHRLLVTGDFKIEEMPVIGNIELLAANILGDLVLKGTRLDRDIRADRVRVGGSVFLHDLANAKNIKLIGSRTTGEVHLKNSHISGLVDLKGAQIGGALELRQGEDAKATWQPGARLILRNASVGALQAKYPESWTIAGKADHWVPMDLGGFTYRRLGSPRDDEDYDLAKVSDPQPLIDWIENAKLRDQGEHTAYNPQPYIQMATTLRSMGASSAADQVDFARYWHRMNAQCWHEEGNLVLCGLNVVALLFVGFGVYPWFPFCWFCLLVFVGWLCAGRSPDLRSKSALERLWYSLETSVPIIELSEAHKAFDHVDPSGTRHWTANWFHVQKFLGFAFATVLVGALALFGG
jgi:hypothetical protein